MANSIVMTPDELRESASKIDGNRDTIVETLTALDQTINTVTEGWKGAAQSSFLESYAEMKKVLDNFPGVLEGISSQLTSAAQIIEDADAQIASAFKG